MNHRAVWTAPLLIAGHTAADFIGLEAVVMPGNGDQAGIPGENFGESIYQNRKFESGDLHPDGWEDFIPPGWTITTQTDTQLVSLNSDRDEIYVFQRAPSRYATGPLPIQAVESSLVTLETHPTFGVNAEYVAAGSSL